MAQKGKYDEVPVQSAGFSFFHNIVKNVNLIYNGHALSYTSTKLGQFTGMPLKQRKQTFQINVTVKNPNWQEADQLAIYKAGPRI